MSIVTTGSLYLFLALLSAVPANAQQNTASAAKPNFPDRGALTGLVSPRDIKTLPADTSLAALKSILRHGGDRRKRADAAVLWASGIGESSRGDWRTIDASLDLLTFFLKNEHDAELRRVAVAAIFGSTYRSMRDFTRPILATKAAGVRYLRLTALRDLALHDSDPRLRGAFERYLPLRTAPNWRELKRREKVISNRLAAAYPDLKAQLTEAWNLDQSKENALSKRALDAERSIKNRPNLTARQRGWLLGNDIAATDYDMYCLWGSRHPRIIQQSLAAANARGFELKIEPVKTWWPGSRSLLQDRGVPVGTRRSQR